MKKLLFSLLLLSFFHCVAAENGSQLWLRLPTDAGAEVTSDTHSSTLRIARAELQKAWRGVPISLQLTRQKNLQPLGEEGYTITIANGRITIASCGEAGLLYGAFHLLRLQETGADVSPEWQTSATIRTGAAIPLHKPIGTLSVALPGTIGCLPNR